MAGGADLFTDSAAVFSPCGKYRYRLWRIWDTNRPSLVMVMLNPSIADDTKNDPTVERCQRRAIAMGYGALQVTNIFALVSTDPAALYATDDPVGPANNDAIREAVKDAGMVLVAWGTHGGHIERAKDVVSLLRNCGVTPYCLGTNADGSPKHPLYVGYAKEPVPFEL